MQAEGVTIHPDYVMNKRDSADIALVRLDRNIQFKVPDVMPICLPSELALLYKTYVRKTKFALVCFITYTKIGA
jgi:hypothetical protein